MRDPSKVLRQWLSDQLQGIIYGSAVPVYSFPPKDAAMPYVVIGDMFSGGEISTKDAFIADYEFTIEVWTSFAGNDASYVPADSIGNSVLEKLRQMPQQGFSGGIAIPFEDFNLIGVRVEGMSSDKFIFDNKIVIYKSFNINLIVEEL